jgi:hypothetical protein
VEDLQIDLMPYGITLTELQDLQSSLEYAECINVHVHRLDCDPPKWSLSRHVVTKCLRTASQQHLHRPRIHVVSSQPPSESWANPFRSLPPCNCLDGENWRGLAGYGVGLCFRDLICCSVCKYVDRNSGFQCFP